MSSVHFPSFACPGHPVYGKPFTIVDPQRATWSVATDRISFIAIKGERPYQRLRAEIDVLTTVLKLLKQEPSNAVAFSKAEVLDRLNPEGLAMVLGVPVELQRLRQLVAQLPERGGLAWNASSLGAPVIGLWCDGYRAYLAGFERTGGLPDFSMMDPAEERFSALMDES